MTAVTRLTAPPVSSYAPGGISEVTVQAVDQIGTATSDQIRHTADRIEAEAHAIGNKLRELADKFDEQTRLASEKISDFCLHMTAARAMVSGLEGQISGKLAAVAEDPSPAFLHTTDATGRPYNATRDHAG